MANYSHAGDGWLRRMFEINSEEETAKAKFAEARDHLLDVQKRRKATYEEFNAWMAGQLGLARPEPVDDFEAGERELVEA